MKNIWEWIKHPIQNYKNYKWKKEQDAALKAVEEEDPFIYD